MSSPQQTALNEKGGVRQLTKGSSSSSITNTLSFRSGISASNILTTGGRVHGSSVPAVLAGVSTLTTEKCSDLHALWYPAARSTRMCQCRVQMLPFSSSRETRNLAHRRCAMQKVFGMQVALHVSSHDRSTHELIYR